MTKINTFQLQGKDIDVLYRKGKLGFTFEHNGKHYGNAVKLTSKSILDVSACTFQLLTCALETLEALNLK